MRVWKELTVIAIVILITLAVGARSGVCVTAAMNCADVKNLTFTDVTFGKPVTITSATLVAASGTTPEYCDVRGTMWPEIGFVVQLPKTGNAKLYQVGGGAWGGNLPAASTLAVGLQMSYTVAGNNGGHDASKESGASFAWNKPDGSNPNYLQKIIDFGYRADQETNLLARKLIKAFYNSDASRAYWVGCSQGGREGMTLSQKLPDLWDGYVIGAPAPGVTWLNLRGLWNSQWGTVFYSTQPTATTAPSGLKADKLVTLAKVVYDKCDGIDGLVDGLIDDPHKCNFDPLTDLLPYACPNDVDVKDSGCFTSAQRTALKKMYSGATMSNGQKLFPGVGLSAEYLTTPGDGNTSGFGIALYDRNSPSFVQFVGNPAPGPTYDWLKFNWDTDWQPIVNLGYGAYWDHALYINGMFMPSQGGMEPLKARGGKVIMYHGLGDVMWPTSAMFYDTLLLTMGYAETQSFYKFYIVPGMGHCGGGIGCYNRDTNVWFLPLVDWVEKGIEPGALNGIRTDTGLPTGKTIRTRPLCPYPQGVRYKGSGSIDKAENFTCMNIIQAEVKIDPDTLDISSGKPGTTFTALITIPEDQYALDGWRIMKDWVISSVVCEGAPAVKVNKKGFRGHTYMAKFNADDLINITAGDAVTFTVTAFAERNGQWIAFEGSDNVKVRVSKPGAYGGYSKEIYSEVIRTSKYIDIRGVQLAIDIYRPAVNGVAVNGQWPVIYSHSSGYRRVISQTTVNALVKRGYVVISDDARGSGASFGQHRYDWSQEEALDCKEVIEWAATQPWSNGKVGMIGGSQMGAMQLLIASTHPPHLVSIVPGVTTIDQFMRHPNGVNCMLPGSPVVPLPTPTPGTPVDGDLPNTDPNSLAYKAFMQRGTPLSLYDCWHGDSHKYIFRDDSISQQGITIQPSIVCSPITYSDLIKSSGVKMYNIAGWYDQAPTSQLGAWKLWGGKLLIGPWTHQVLETPQFPLSKDISVTEYLRWFDYTLKGIENWIMDEDPIYYYTMNAPTGKEWGFTGQWPLPNQNRTKYYFDFGPTNTVASVNDGGLGTVAPTAFNTSDDYTVDYSVKVFDGAFKENRRLFTGDMATNTDSKGLTYTTAPLTDNINVTGHPVVNLWVSSTSADGDFHVFLEEVDGKTNKSTMVTNGIMRASSRALQRLSPWTAMGIPYHRVYEEDADLLTPGKAVQLTLDLYATSYVLRKGNRIRVSITGSNAPTYDGLVESPPPTVSIYRDRRYKSYIELPVISAAGL